MIRMRVAIPAFLVAFLASCNPEAPSTVEQAISSDERQESIVGRLESAGVSDVLATQMVRQWDTGTPPTVAALGSKIDILAARILDGLVWVHATVDLEFVDPAIGTLQIGASLQENGESLRVLFLATGAWSETLTPISAIFTGTVEPGGANYDGMMMGFVGDAVDLVWTVDDRGRVLEEVMPGAGGNVIVLLPYGGGLFGSSEGELAFGITLTRGPAPGTKSEPLSPGDVRIAVDLAGYLLEGGEYTDAVDPGAVSAIRAFATELRSGGWRVVGSTPESFGPQVFVPIEDRTGGASLVVVFGPDSRIVGLGFDHRSPAEFVDQPISPS